jgi:ribosomal protein L13E
MIPGDQAKNPLMLVVPADRTMKSTSNTPSTAASGFTVDDVKIAAFKARKAREALIVRL